MKKSKGIRWFDWVLFIVLAVASHLLFQQTDIFHTAGASFAYLNGHITDFYSYTDQALGGCAYMPTTYILFAIWNLPLKLFGIQTEVTMNHTFGVQLWYSGLPILCYVGITVIMWKLALVMGFERKKARAAAYGFAASPIAFFSQFIICQYDSITLLFIMLGVYYYFKDDTVKFVLFFAIAVTCKYYALLIFVPMLLLKEKNIWRIIAQGVGFISLFALEFVFYLQDRSMAGNITGFNATGYIFNVAFETGEVFPKIGIVVLLWATICAWSFFMKPEGKTTRWKWFLYLESIVLFCIFGLSMWHPQWVLLAIPFMVFGSMMQERTDVFWLLDLILMLCYVWFTIRSWPNHLDHCLLRGGLLYDLIGNRWFSGITMRDFLPYRIGHMSIPFSVMSALFLINALFKHPKFMIESPESEHHVQEGLLRLRFLGGIAMYLVPVAICVCSMLQSPYADSNRIMDAYSPDWVISLQEGEETHILEQYFTAPWKNLERVDFKFDSTEELTGELRLIITDEGSGETILETLISRNEIIPAEAYHVTFDPVAVEEGHTYRAALYSSSEDGGYLGLYYIPWRTNDAATLLDGEEQNLTASMVFFGR